MNWTAPLEKDIGAASLEKNLWDTAAQFRANSGLKAQEYSGPTLGIIFLRIAEVLQRQIPNLRQTRDPLLPRLLSGQVGIE